MAKTVNKEDLKPNGRYWHYVVDVMSVFNDYGKVEYTLANCTVCVCVLALINNLPKPVSKIGNANLFHTLVANGWKTIPYQRGMEIKENDILEWGCNHVAYAISNDKVYASWWTNYNGTSKGDRDMRMSMIETSNYIYNNYPYRYFHETTFDDECKRGGGNQLPTYLLRYDQNIIKPVDRDITKNQIKVNSNEQNFRAEPSINGEIKGVSQVGYYNVLDEQENDYIWYKVNDLWIAKTSRVEYLPKEDIDYKKLYEITKDKLERIRSILDE